MQEKTFYILDDNTLRQINENNNKCIVELNNTLNLSYNLLKKIKNKNAIFIIKSALAEKKYYESEDNKYRKRTIFTLNQTKKIIKVFEKIDKLVSTKHSDLQKTLLIYNLIAKKIDYEENHCFNRKQQDIRRTLYSIVSKKAVCSGFALILFEILSRNNIENYYMHSQNHLFNVVKIDNKFYPLDVTWESALKQKNKDALLHYFGNYPLFSDSHKLVENEKKINYSYFDTSILHNKKIKLKTHKCIRNNNTHFYISQLPIGCNLKFYVIYDSFYNIFNIISSMEDFDRVFNGKDKYLINCYKSSLLKGERVINKIKDSNCYVGYGEIIGEVFYKHNKCENIIKINQKANKNSIKFEYKGIFYTITFKNKKFKLIMENLC